MPQQYARSVRHARQDLEIVVSHIRDGQFQRSLSFLTAATSVLSGLEVAYEHYRGSYSQRVMYTPVIMSAVLTLAGIAGFFITSSMVRRSLRRCCLERPECSAHWPVCFGETANEEKR